MTIATVISRSTFVRGHITGTGDLEIAGRIEGDVTCTGEVVIEATGLLAANVSARRIVVRGAVKGDLVADDAVVIESGARVVGDLRAPRIAIIQGGLVRGYVQTGAAGEARPRATQARAATPVKTAAPAAPAPAKTAPAKTAPAAPKTNHVAAKAPAPRGATLAGARVGPPPPVVPALKKGTKAVQKKR